MSFKTAQEYLKKLNLEDKIIEFTVSSATVKEAALALNCKEQEIAKSMGFLLQDKPILIVTAGDQKIDNSKYKKYFGIKAKMIPITSLNELVGHEAGGICPFGINAETEVYLDESLKRFEYVYPACGSDNSCVKLTIKELEKASNFKNWIDVCKNIE